MLFIHDQIILANQLKDFLNDNNDKLTTRDLIKSIININGSNNFYNVSKLEYDYKILISSTQDLEIFMEFFKKYPLVDNEYICIKRNNVNLKDTYEIISKYEKFDFIDKIYVEQLDKEEWINYDDYQFIYYFLKKFESTLPNNPTNTDIIINAYDYVKQREYFMEEDKKSLISKKFSSSVLTPYIVCAGFVKQFNCILKEYNIPCFEYQFINSNNIGHDVSLVYIDGMGIYFFDITRDSYSYEDEKSYLKNETKYSGFMLPYTYYLDNKILKDNFSNELLKRPNFFELRQRYAQQQIAMGNDKKVDIFDEDQFKNVYLLQTLIDVNFELLKYDNFFEEVSDNNEIMNNVIYSALSKINKTFGTEVTDINIFLDMLISAKANTNLRNNEMYYRKSIISKFSDTESINLSEAMDIVTKKLTK